MELKESRLSWIPTIRPTTEGLLINFGSWKGHRTRTSAISEQFC
jgi:hypothetical protein